MEQIKNPNVVKFIEHFHDQTYQYIIMEYCAQGDMSKYLKEKQFVPE